MLDLNAISETASVGKIQNVADDVANVSQEGKTWNLSIEFTAIFCLRCSTDTTCRGNKDCKGSETCVDFQ